MRAEQAHTRVNVLDLSNYLWTLSLRMWLIQQPLEVLSLRCGSFFDDSQWAGARALAVVARAMSGAQHVVMLRICLSFSFSQTVGLIELRGLVLHCSACTAFKTSLVGANDVDYTVLVFNYYCLLRIWELWAAEAWSRVIRSRKTGVYISGFL